MVRFKVNSSVNWLVNSGICINEKENTMLGGVYAGYNVKQKNWDFIYNEITGYTVSAFCVLYKKTKDKTFLDLANSSASFLMKHQIPVNSGFDSGAFYKGFGLADNKPITTCFSFDVAMVIQGLIDLFQITKDEGLKQSAILAGNWLLTMQDSSGFFYAHYDLKTKSKKHPGLEFYQDGGCLHAKHAIALLKLFKISEDEKFQNRAKLVCDWVLTLQDNDGAFWVNESHSHVYAHAHCYATEGLIFAFNHFKNPKYQKAINRACEWLDKNFNRIHWGILGTHKCAKWYIPIESTSKNKWAQLFRSVYPRKEIATDATIQSARLFLYLKLVDEKDCNFYIAKKIIKNYTLKVLNKDSSLVQQGGLHSRLDISMGLRRSSPIIATWGVLFYIASDLLMEEIMTGNRSNMLINDLF